MIKLFCKNNWELLIINYFHKKNSIISILQSPKLLLAQKMLLLLSIVAVLHIKQNIKEWTKENFTTNFTRCVFEYFVLF